MRYLYDRRLRWYEKLTIVDLIASLGWVIFVILTVATLTGRLGELLIWLT